MSWAVIDIGDHVRTRRRTGGGLITPAIARGQVGIVRQVSGFFTRTATVEFLHGGEARVPIRDLERTLVQGGEEGWARRRERHRGFQIGMLILNLPLIFALAKYFLNGGSIGGLAPAIIDAGMGLLLRLLGNPELLLLAVIPLFLVHRARRG